MYAIDKEGAPLAFWRFLLLPGGRISRAPFNLALLAYFLAIMATGAVGSLLKSHDIKSDALVVFAALFVVFGQYVLFTLGAKRLHDLGRSGWWQLLYLLPLFNIILGFVVMAKPGKPEDNAYGVAPGAQPRQAGAAETKGAAAATGGDEAVAAPITYPLPFLKVLLSFDGRLNRRVFWLKGVLPLVVIGFIVHSLVTGVAVFVYGAGLVRDIIGIGKSAPLVPVSQFMTVDGGTIGVVRTDTKGARLEIGMAAQPDVASVSRLVVINGRRVAVTATRKPKDHVGYDLAFEWFRPPPAPVAAAAPKRAGEWAFSGISAVISLLLLWPWFAIAVKRFHDRDQSGWWSLIGLVPLIGQIWLLVVLGFLKGSSGDNRFGPDPLAASA